MNNVNKMLFEYNSTEHDSTHYTPHFLMFDREPKLPIDGILGLEPHGDINTHSEFAKEWKEQMMEAYRIAQDNSDSRKKKDCDKKNNKKHLLSGLSEEDRVLVKNVTERGGPGKLRSYWEQEVYMS